MKVVAEVLTGGLFYVEVQEEAMIKDIKNKIVDQENLPLDRILMLDAEQRDLINEDDVSLKEYGIQDGSHIYIFFKPLPDYSTTSPPMEDPFPDDESSLSTDTLEKSSNETDVAEYLEDSPVTNCSDTPPSLDYDPSDQMDE